MATIDKSIKKIHNGLICTWGPMAAADDGDPLGEPSYKKRTVQIEVGTIGDSSVAIEGSNDGTNFRVLNDINGNALSAITTSKIDTIAEVTKWIRPKLTGSTGTGIVVTITAML